MIKKLFLTPRGRFILAAVLMYLFPIALVVNEAVRNPKFSFWVHGLVGAGVPILSITVGLWVAWRYVLKL